MTSVEVEAIAARVAELIHDRAAVPVRWVDTATVARMLSVSEHWVRAHAVELGAVRVGNSRSGPLRFDVRRIEATLESWRVGRPGPGRRAGQTRRRRRRHLPSDVELLPLPDGVGSG